MHAFDNGAAQRQAAAWKAGLEASQAAAKEEESDEN
jgi:hypothetical protein